MSLIDLVAIVGALAWIPPIFSSVRDWLTKPEIRVITQPSPEIGYTTLGQILNLRVALTVKHKDIVITGIRLRVTHESGEETLFSWRGIVQRMGTMNYPQVGSVPFEKESNVLAMKVSQKDIEERFIRFQNLDFLANKGVIESPALKKLAYLQNSGTLDEISFLKCQEMTDLYSFISQSFSWKSGGYRLKVLLESPDVFSVLDDEYTFTLSPLHVQKLQDNLKHIESYFANEVTPPKQGEEQTPVAWSWVYPDMQKVTD